MPKADISRIEPRTSSSYPEEHRAPLEGRKAWILTGEFGLSQFGINRVELAPGAWSTQRHWHSRNDEAVIVVEGELWLVTDAGEERLVAGDCAAFKAGEPDAHHLQNRSDRPAVFFDIGGRDPWDKSTFPDIGMEARTMMRVQFRAVKGT